MGTQIVPLFSGFFGLQGHVVDCIFLQGTYSGSPPGEGGASPLFTWFLCFSFESGYSVCCLFVCPTPKHKQ